MWRRITAVPSELISDEKLRMCGELQLKVLLCMLRDGTADAQTLAASLRRQPGDVQDALDYWAGQGVLASGDAPAQKPEAPARKPEAPAQKPEAPAQKPETSGTAPQEPRERRNILLKPPVRLTAKEMERLAARPEVKSMLTAAEAMLGKTFTSSDTSTLLWLTDWAGVPPDMLLTVISYCAERDKRNLNYIQALAVEWMNDGIETAAQAESYIKQRQAVHSYENAVRGAFGIRDRALTTKERKIVAEWADAGFELPLLKAAYERTVEAIGKLSFPYANKILFSWREKGIKTPEDVERERAAAKENRHVERSYDIEEVEKLFADDLNNLSGGA